MQIVSVYQVKEPRISGWVWDLGADKVVQVAQGQLWLDLERKREVSITRAALGGDSQP